MLYGWYRANGFFSRRHKGAGEMQIFAENESVSIPRRVPVTQYPRDTGRR